MPDQLILNLRISSETTLETYQPVVDQDELIETVRSLARNEGDIPQLYLWGRTGTGKTHLAQGACHEAGACGYPVAYLPLRQVKAAGPEVLDGLSSVRVLVIDDLDQVWAQPEWQHALFNMINQARESETRLLFTAAARPEADQVPLADLRSRLLWGPVFHLRPLDEERLQGMLRRAAQARGFTLGQAEIGYLLRRAARDPASLMALLDRLDTASLKARSRVTVPLIRAMLDQD